MLFQFVLGTGFTMLTLITAALAFGALEAGLVRLHDWIARPPHRVKMMMVLCLAVLWSFLIIVLGVWVWGVAFLVLDVFETLEEAVYFSLVAVTTLGFGDVLLPEEWRLLSGMAAANGLLLFGLLTAVLVEVLRFARLEQETPDDKAEPVAGQLAQRRKVRGFFSPDRR